MQTHMRRPRRLAIVCTLFTAVIALAAEPVTIVATDLLKLRQLESPALSPDGRWVVYVVRSIVPKSDTKDDWVYQTNLWMAATDGSSPPRALTTGTGADSAPTWSPAGDRIAFVRTAEKEKPQIRVLPFTGGESIAITKVESGAAAPRWSPDGTKLLFTSALTYAQVRDALEKLSAGAKPAWPFEKPARPANDTANAGLKKQSADTVKPMRAPPRPLPRSPTVRSPSAGNGSRRTRPTATRAPCTGSRFSTNATSIPSRRFPTSSRRRPAKPPKPATSLPATQDSLAQSGPPMAKPSSARARAGSTSIPTALNRPSSISPTRPVAA